MIARAVVCLVVFSAQAISQFPGDIFFSEPNLVAVEGGEAVFEVVIFSGDEPFGGALFDVVSSDESIAAVVDVRVSESTSDDFFGNQIVEGASASSLVLNGESLDSPFGSITLAEVTVAALGSAGSAAQLTLVPREAVVASGESYPSLSGFAGSLTIVSPTTAVTVPARDAPRAVPDHRRFLDIDANRGPVPVRREGHAFSLIRLGRSNEVVREVVIVRATGASDQH